MDGSVFNIQRFSTKDGPGIRSVVFFKGCPLSCIWCHNPESKLVDPEIFFDISKCLNCKICEKTCPENQHFFLESEHIFLRKNCIKCLRCSEVCPTKALESCGKIYKTKEIIDGEEKSRLIVFSKYKKKLLLDLLFEPSPVEENYPETIISAVENDGNKAIKDSSISYKKRSYIRKVLLAVVVGGIFAYIGYTVRDGFGWVEIVSICMYLTTLLTTAVTAFTSGETCSKVYKSHFYLDLANFIDGFNEWNYRQPKIINKENE